MAATSTKLILETVVKGGTTASNSIGKISKKLGTLSKAAIAASVAAAGIFVSKSIKTAAQFESKMANINTLLNKSQKELKEYGNQVLKIGSRVPVENSLLSEALYDVVSAGITNTADSLKVLEQSARLGVAGLGDAKQSVDIVTSAINAYGLSADDAARVSDIMFKTVKYGKNTISQLSSSFGLLAPIASQSGVSLEEMSAATAALTAVGIPASEAQNSVRAAIFSLIKPSTNMKKIFKELNVVSGTELIKSSGGLVNAFNRVRQAENTLHISETSAVGRKEALLSITSLLGKQNGIYSKTLADMKSGSNAVNKAFADQSKTTKFQYEIMKNNLNKVMKDLGDKILPDLTKKVKNVNTWFNTLNETGKTNGEVLSDDIGVAADVLSTILGALGDSLIQLNTKIHKNYIEWRYWANGVKSMFAEVDYRLSEDRAQYQLTAENQIKYDKLMEKSSIDRATALSVLGVQFQSNVNQSMASSEQLAKLTQASGDKINKAFEGVGKSASKAKDSIKNLASSAVKDFKEIYNKVQSVSDKIESIQKSIQQLVGDYVSKEKDDRQDLAKSIVESENKVIELQKKRAELTKQYGAELNANKKFSIAEELGQVQSSLDAELEAQRNNAELIKRFDNEVAEVKRVNSLSTLEKAIESFNKSRAAAKLAFNERIEQIKQETLKTGAQARDIIKIVIDRNKDIKKDMEKATGDYKNQLTQQLKDTQELVGSMILLFERLNKTRAGASSSVNGINHGQYRANGGSVTAGQPYIVGEKRPELFVPSTNGTIIPKVPTGGSNVNIHIDTMIGEESFAEKMGDMIVRQLAGNVAI